MSAYCIYNVILNMLKLMYNTYSVNNIIASYRHFKCLIYCYLLLLSARDIDVTLITILTLILVSECNKSYVLIVCIS